MRKVIGFFGVARSGKSTAAHYAAEYFRKRDIPAYVRSFAGPLKEGLATMGIHKDTHPDLYRLAAQYMGTEICREYDSNWWVKQTKHRIDNTPKDGVVLIDDCRFPNEFEYLRSIDADLIFMRGGKRIDLSSSIYNHDSETIAMEYEMFWEGVQSGVTRGVPLLPEARPDHVVLNHVEMPIMFEHLEEVLQKIEVRL